MSRRQAEDFAQDSSPRNRSLHGLVRRMTLANTRRASWQLAGYRNVDGSKGETIDAEPFSGIGIYARPLATDNAEAVLVQIGDARHSVIVATRNEQARRAIVDKLNGGSGLAENEVAIFSRAGLLHIKADGTMEARTPSGSAELLATKQDLLDLAQVFTNWVVAPMDGGGALKTLLTSLISGGWPAGTSKFKAE